MLGQTIEVGVPEILIRDLPREHVPRALTMILCAIATPARRAPRRARSLWVLILQITATLPGSCRGRNVEGRFQVDIASSDTGPLRASSTLVVSRTESSPCRKLTRRRPMTQIAMPR